MDIQAQITIRIKKLGALIRDARQASRKSLEECAEAIGVPKGILKAYEEGRRAPSLPQIELLVYYLKLPINHFWSKEVLPEDASSSQPLDLEKLLHLRQRLVGALLRQERMNANISLKPLSQQTGISPGLLNAYELGERPIPLPVLEGVLTVLGGRIETFLDQSGPIGQWMARQKAIQDFLELPNDLQAFVCQPVNRPYLELARNLSQLSTEKLRAVAEGLLDITL